MRGTGVNQPEGFPDCPRRAPPKTTYAPSAWCSIIGSGNASGFDSAPDAKLIDLIHSLKSSHRQGAVFVMNSATLATVRKLKNCRRGLPVASPEWWKGSLTGCLAIR